MIEVKLYLYSREERAIFNAALDAIETMRARQNNLDLSMDPRVINVPHISVPCGSEPETTLTTTAVTDTVDAANVPGEPTPTITPAAERLVTDEQLDPQDAESMMTAYLKANGMAAARAILDKFNVKRVRDLPSELRGELVKALVAK